MSTSRQATTLVLGCLFLAGCETGLEQFPVARASGVLLCESQPVEDVIIFFEPLGDGSSVTVGKAAMGLSDEQGTFQLTTYKAEDGAVIGKHRVRVMPRSAQSKCNCVLNDTIDVTQVAITPDGPNHFEVALKPRTARDLPDTLEIEDDDQG